MADLHNLTCPNCYIVGPADVSDGFFYCRQCGSQYEDVLDTAVDDDDFFNGGDTAGAVYKASQRRRPVKSAIKAEPISQYSSFYDSQSNLIRNLGLDDQIPQQNNDHNFHQVKREESEAHFFDWESPSVPADFGDLGNAKVPCDEDYHDEIKVRYVMGLQMMIELQCEALVKEFKVTPLVCGLVGPIWLRFVSRTGVFDDDWVDKVIQNSKKQEEVNSEKREEGNDDIREEDNSEKREEGTKEKQEEDNSEKREEGNNEKQEGKSGKKRKEKPKGNKTRAKYRAEPHNTFGQRVVMILFRCLKKRIPLACTVAVSFLACHVAREAVLPSDIMKWTLEGKLPYFSAFVEIERRMGPSSTCPINSNLMFRPKRAVTVQKLESFAASIAQLIGLELPPVNFYAIAYRYLQKLSLPVEKILPYACRIYEWAMPPDLWLSLSKNYFRLPTHVCVMSILVVAIRILYNINGLGEWEKSLSSEGNAKDNGEMGTAFASHNGPDFGKYSDEDKERPEKHELDSAGLIQHFQARYNEIADTHEYSKDLPTYLKYCRDVVFAGSEASYDEEDMINSLWTFYQNKEDAKPSEPGEQSNSSFYRSRSKDEGSGGRSRTSKEGRTRKECFSESSRDDGMRPANDLRGSVDNDDLSESSADSDDSESREHSSGSSHVKEAIRQMKLDMEENRFYYIPPSIRRTRSDYLHYARKRDEGAFTYVAHADYYILLRACARVAQVDFRIMHIGVLSLERRFARLENRIDQCLHTKPTNISCQFCTDVAPENESDDTPGLSNLSI